MVWTIVVITIVVLMVLAYFLDRRRRGLGDRDVHEETQIARQRDDLRNEGHGGPGGIGGPGGVG
jgi:hypothetical protein